MKLLATLGRAKEIAACRKETKQWLPLTLSYLGIRRISYPYHLELRTGESFTLQEPMDLVIFWLVFARRFYPVTGSESVIVDVGANVGMFTVYAARKAPLAQVISVEPFHGTFERLKQHVKENKLIRRVHCLNVALSGSVGTSLMHGGGGGVPSQHSSLADAASESVNINYQGKGMPGASPALAEEISERVHTETIASLLQKEGIGSADLVKMNIHGVEYEVLLKSDAETLRRIKRLAIVHHELPENFGIGKEQLVHHLTSAGLELVSDEETGRGSGLAVFALPSNYSHGIAAHRHAAGLK